MKAIAEYFRDLAADDRYFGAEPPQPDAQVLAKIAERELSRVVQGRSDGNTVVLTPAGVEPSAPAEPVVQAPVEQAPATKSDDTLNTGTLVLETQVPDQKITVATAVDPTPAPAAIETPVDAAPAEFAAAVETVTQTQDDEDLEDLRALSVARQEAAQQSDQETESVTEKLRRLRGVAAAASKPSTMMEDEHAEDFSDPGNNMEPATKVAPVQVAPVAQTPQPAAAEPEIAGQNTSSNTDAEQPRVIKMKKADLDRLLAAQSADASVQTDQAASADLDGLDDFVSDAKSDVKVDAALLAQLNADLGIEDTPEPLEPVAEVPAEPAAAAATPRPRRPQQHLEETDEADLNRILRQTNAELESEQQRDRHKTFENLKAAVAAADEGENTSDESNAEALFRKDLAQVVQPRRPNRGESTPLKLVASQRVDLAQQEQPKAPAQVQPRKADSFADYLHQVRATELEDILEAAAAYTVFVEGNDVFSRPQVMRKVSAALTDDFSREDCLRVFGQLLRNGTLQRQGGGHFVIDENSRYHPEHRAAG